MQQNLGRVQGSKWYTGTGITGTDTTPTVFSGSGVTYALLNDLYLNTTTGAVYQCDLKGSPAVAKWKFIANITGPTPELIDNLRSESTTKALTANQGRVLSEKLYTSGVFANSYDVDVTEAVYIAELKIRNVETTIVFNSADDSGTYHFNPIGISETYTISVDIGSNIGFETEGAVLTQIVSTDNIYSVELKDGNGDTILDKDLIAWELINEALSQVKPSGSVTDGSETLKQALLKKLIDGTLTTVYPVTHAKSVYYDKANAVTVHDALASTSVDRGGTGASSLASGEAVIGNGTSAVTTRAITNNTSTTDALTGSTNLATMNTVKNAMNRETGIGSADTNYSTSMVRGISAGTTDLTAGTSALTSGAIHLVYQS